MRWLAELAASLGFGVAAAILPVFNNEAYVLGSQLTGLAGAWPVIVGLGIGNGLGKTIVFLLVRAGKRLPWWRGLRPTDMADDDAPLGWWSRQRARWRRWLARLMTWVGDPRWGAPVVALSAATSIPPIYPVTLLAGATRMPTWAFALANTLGSLARMALLVAVALGLVRLF